MQTWISSIDQLPPILDYDIRHGRTYMYDTIEPLFAFGHGLSYTTFDYGDITLSRPAAKQGDVVDVSLEVTNTGNVGSDEVVELYVQYPGSAVERPLISLKGFKRVNIPAGGRVKVTIPLKTDDLRYWDTRLHAFVLEKGPVRILAGRSSADIRQTVDLMME